MIKDLKFNFEKYDNSYVDVLNTPYDYDSVMHYGKYDFSANYLPTIEPLQKHITIGQREYLSTIDLEEVRLFYNCSSTQKRKLPTTITTKKPPVTATTTKPFIPTTTTGLLKGGGAQEAKSVH